ncbi:glycosyltransferase family 4 protein [candidate division KSB1 bacterium]|nr:glycosyltransferase family 4 protein [candidate division KSB1 bacterium]
MKIPGILFLIDNLSTLGGTEKHLLVLARALQAAGIAVRVCPLMPLQSQVIQLFLQKGIDVQPLGINRPYGARAMRQVVRLSRFMRESGSCYLQTYHFGSDLIGTLIKAIFPTARLISNRRDMGFDEAHPRYRLMRRFLNKRADLIVTVSERLKQEIRQREGAPAYRLRTVYNGIESAVPHTPQTDNHLRPQLGLSSCDRIVGLIANIRPIKGIDVAIEAWPKVQRQIPNAHLLIIGGLPAGDQDTLATYNQNLRRRVDSLDLNKTVHFLGPRSNIQELLPELDLAVLPSRSEGFSNTLIESMAAGLAVVATDVGGNPEAIDSGRNGLLVPPEKPSELARAIVLLLKDDALRHRLSEQGRKDSRKRFSLQQMISSYLAIYQELLPTIDSARAWVENRRKVESLAG